MSRVLILGGTAEARMLAGRLSEMTGIDPLVSLAGVTANPAGHGVPVRTGGFGGADGLRDWMASKDIAALIDATHPFADRMQANAADAASMAAIPRIRLLRPPWPVRPRWTVVATAEEAAVALPPGARVLLTSGRKELAPFAARRDVSFVLRTIEPVADLSAHIEPLLARPPFTLADEQELFTLLGITHLVSKNAGGTGTAKLDAAESLGIETVMIARPAPPPGPVAASIDAVVAWLLETVANDIHAPETGPDRLTGRPD